MKKLLGISLVAVLAATPLMASAADLTQDQLNHGSIVQASENNPGDAAKMATVSYVKGAYTELGTAINTKADKTALTAEENRATGVESGLNTRLTTAEGDIDALEAAVNNATTGLATRASQTALESEVNRATGAENALSGRITAIENVQGDYATKTGVNNTINALEYTTTLQQGSSVTGTVSVPTSGTVATVTDWANQTPGTAVVSFTNSDIALANGTVASAALETVATTANYATANNEL